MEGLALEELPRDLLASGLDSASVESGERLGGEGDRVLEVARGLALGEDDEGGGEAGLNEIGLRVGERGSMSACLLVYTRDGKEGTACPP